MRYQAHHVLADAAAPKSELWRLIAGIVLIGALTLVLMAVWLFGQARITGTEPTQISMGMTPFDMIATLYSFVCVGVALWIALWLLHRRGFGSLISGGGARRDAVRVFWRVFGVACALLGLALLVPMPENLTPVQAMPVADWIKWVPLALPALFIQTGAEELVFRGYLQSQLAARFRSPWIWIVVPSAIFASLHFDPAAGANVWPIMGVTFLFGVIAADLTARSGNLGPAVALHMANNISSLLFVGLPGGLSGLSLYLLPVESSDPALTILFPIEALLLLIVWLGARLVIRR